MATPGNIEIDNSTLLLIVVIIGLTLAVHMLATFVMYITLRNKEGPPGPPGPRGPKGTY